MYPGRRRVHSLVRPGERHPWRTLPGRRTDLARPGQLTAAEQPRARSGAGRQRLGRVELVAAPLDSALNNLRGEFFVDYNLLSAGSVMIAIPTILVFLLLQRQFVRDLTLGATKG